MTPISMLRLVSPALLPLVTLPWLLFTEPTTSVVITSGVSLYRTPVAATLPLLAIVITYSSVSPTLGTPLRFASAYSISAFEASNTGAATIGVIVGSPPCGVVGSLVGTGGSSLLLTVPWLSSCVTPGGSGLTIVTWKLIVTLAPLGSTPIFTVTGGVPALPPVIVPWLALTEPFTSVVLTSGVSLKVTPVAWVLPVFSMITWYSSVSPADGTPLRSASANRLTALSAVSTGAAVIGVSVGSPGVGVLGSSVGTAGPLAGAATPWLLMRTTPAGSGLLIVTRKLIVTLAPPPGIVPISMLGLVSPAVLPLVTAPWLVCTEPTTSLEFGSRTSLNFMPDAAPLPVFWMVTW